LELPLAAVVAVISFAAIVPVLVIVVSSSPVVNDDPSFARGANVRVVAPFDKVPFPVNVTASVPLLTVWALEVEVVNTA
jgi:hypothetical protein